MDVIHAAIPRLRRALDRLDLPDDGPTRSPADLRAEIIRASDEFGYLDLSARLIDLMRTAAQVAEDPLLLATVAYVRTETFFATGDLDTATHAVELAADQVPALGSASSSAALGALHMRAAVVAGRGGKPHRAADHLREARHAAAAVPEGIYQGTAFGPASLRIHELAVAVELRDPLGIKRAASWQPPRELPAERRSHYHIELARAQLALGHHEDAYQSLQAARQTAPEHTRTHPQVRQSLSALLRTHRTPSSGLLDLAAWARVR